jgi:Ca2+-binding RTX toxin-like protein
VNTNVQNIQQHPSITDLSDGGFLISWTSGNIPDGIYAQRYDSNANKSGGEFQVHSATLYSQKESDVSLLNDGGFVFSWVSPGQDEGDSGIYAQRYDSNANKFGGEFQVDIHTSSSGVSNPSVSPLVDGGFFVSWTSAQSTSDPASFYGYDINIFAQRYDSSSNVVGSEFQVNNDNNDWLDDSDVIELNNGGFVIAWGSLSQANQLELFARMYDSSGVALDSQFQIGNSDDNASSPSFDALEDGGFVVTWDSVFGGIYAQRYDSSGDPVGSHLNDIMVGTSAIDNILAYGGNDTLTGDAGADQLDGGTGQDTMTGGLDNDTFVIRSGDGNIDINLADIITDFTDGEDVLGGAGSIDSFDQLTVAQGTGDNTVDTVVSLTSTSEILAVLVDFTATDFDASDFVASDIV